MHLDLRLFSLPKAGNTADENEDAFTYAAEGKQQRTSGAKCLDVLKRLQWESPLRIAITDGATESSFSGVWARLIARAFCKPTALRPGSSACDFDDEEALKKQSLRLLDRAAMVWRRCHKHRRLPWYAEEKMEMGAFSALIGLRLCPARESLGNGIWTAIAGGDACLFHFRSGKLKRAFPIDSHEGFSSRPWLLSSKGRSDSDLASSSGEWYSGDEFALATDALACWIHHARSLGEDVAAVMRSLSSLDTFATWVNRQRQSEGPLPPLRNDDVTLAWCGIAPETDRPPGT